MNWSRWIQDVVNDLLRYLERIADALEEIAGKK